MASNVEWFYLGPGKVAVQSIDYPEIEDAAGKGKSTTASSSRPSRPTSAAATSTWSAAAPQRRADWFWGTRLPAK